MFLGEYFYKKKGIFCESEKGPCICFFCFCVNSFYVLTNSLFFPPRKEKESKANYKKGTLPKIKKKLVIKHLSLEKRKKRKVREKKKGKRKNNKKQKGRTKLSSGDVFHTKFPLLNTVMSKVECITSRINPYFRILKKSLT